MRFNSLLEQEMACEAFVTSRIEEAILTHKEFRDFWSEFWRFSFGMEFADREPSISEIDFHLKGFMEWFKTRKEYGEIVEKLTDEFLGAE